MMGRRLGDYAHLGKISPEITGDQLNDIVIYL